MKDKVKRHLNFKKEKISIYFICALAFMLSLKIYFWHEYKTTNEN